MKSLTMTRMTHVSLTHILLTVCFLPGYSCMDPGNYSFMETPPPECLDEALPEGVVEWVDWTTAPELEVIWGFGNETCSTEAECFGDRYADDDLLPAQMMPVQIQIGTKLRFRASGRMESKFLIQPYEVSAEDFAACNTSDGRQLASNYTAEAIQVGKLTAGRHYFITHTTDHLYRCEFGLRLMVIVKNNRCSKVGQPSPCWSKGRCVSSVLQENYTCACCHGFTGDYCNYQDSCYNNPCQNNATCYALGEDSRGPVYKCMCPQGFYGAQCEHEAGSLCDTQSCQHGATCVGNKTTYTCVCHHGYTGHHCEVDINDCEDAPCGNGICVDDTGRFKCYCSPGFTGSRCDIPLDLCSSNPCKNHGVCIKDEDQGYSCQCPRGYKGKDCSVKNALCTPSPCVHALECVDYGHSFTCTCETGYAGSLCEVNLNECASDPCHNGGKCIDMVAGYRCVCPHGVHGPGCQFVSHRLYQPEEHDNSEYSSSPWKHRTRWQNLILVAGTLGGAAFLAMMVVALCYCKVNETYKNIPLWIRTKGYRRHINDKGRQSIRRASSTLGSRPSIDAIMEATTPAYSENSLNRPIQASLKARRV